MEALRRLNNMVRRDVGGHDVACLVTEAGALLLRGTWQACSNIWNDGCIECARLTATTCTHCVFDDWIRGHILFGVQDSGSHLVDTEWFIHMTGKAQPLYKW